MDLFASKANTQLQRFGQSGFIQLRDEGKLSSSILYCNGDFSDYSNVINFLRDNKVVAMIVAPLWDGTGWFGEMLRFTTHMWEIQREKDTFLPASQCHLKGINVPPWRVAIFVADFRSPPVTSDLLPLVRGAIPTIIECSKIRANQWKCQPKFKGKVTAVKSSFNLSFLSLVSEGIVDERIREIVLNGIAHGFRSGYRGGSSFFRDYSKRLPQSEAEEMKAKMEEEVKKGHCLGPYKQCPFPNSWCEDQAICCLQFFRPKHRFKDDGKFRLISHRSFPTSRSFNDLIPRQDCKSFIDGYEYFSVQSFIKVLARKGKGALMAFFDIKDAYKQCRIHPSDLWQQVYTIKGDFYVDLGGMFGSRNAGDSWNLTMELIISSLKAYAQVDDLFYFVDNAVYVEDSGKPDDADRKFKRILNFLQESQVPFHEVITPTSKAVFLGWTFDTIAMTVSIIGERKSWVDEQLNGLETMDSQRLLSAVGVFEFLAAVLFFLKAPLGWLRHRQIELERGTLVFDGVFRDRLASYLKYVKRLLREWKGSVPIIALPSSSDRLIFVDASGTEGRGAVCMESKSFAYQLWESCELKSATRAKAVSSAGLELLNAASAVCTFAVPNSSVIVFSDSAAAVAIGNKKYSRSDSDQWALICLDRFCLDNGIQVKFEHLPRENEWIRACDQLSKGEIPEEFIGPIWVEVKFRGLPLEPF